MSARFLRRALLVVAVSGICLCTVSTAARAERWNGHPFVFVFTTDDGTNCNLGWADVARAMDFRFTIAVNEARVTPQNLTAADLNQLHADGFEIANHAYSHGTAGLPASCPTPPRGSLMAYFNCPDLDPAAAAAQLRLEIDRRHLADFAQIPLEAVNTLAYPRHLHGKALVDSLVAVGYIGARAGANADFFQFGSGEFAAPGSNSWDDGISLFRVPLAAYADRLFGNHSAAPAVHHTYAQFVAVAQPLIDKAVADGGIFTVFAHHFGDDDDTYGDINYGSAGMTPTDLEWLVDLVRANGGAVMTFTEAVSYYRARSRLIERDGDLVWVPADPGVTVDTETVSAITGATPCALAVPVTIRRDVTTPVRGYSVTFALSPEIALCDDPQVSIRAGDYLAGLGQGTQFFVTDHGDGTYTVDGVILGSPCGTTVDLGTLFTIDLTGAVGEGTGTVTLLEVDIRDCSGAPFAVAVGPDGTIAIDTVAPLPVTDLVAAPADTGGAPQRTLPMTVAWTASASPDVARTAVYRKGFGGYPEYDDAGGTEPALGPAATPQDAENAGWTLVGFTTEATATDLRPDRDAWSYVAFTQDQAGNVSPPSALTAGVVNYLLGDVSDGTVSEGQTLPGDGDNRVDGLDMSLLGTYYGLSLARDHVANRLDLGPLVGNPLSGRPATDDQVDFEDLVLLAINFGTTALTTLQQPLAVAPPPAATNTLAVAVDGPAAVGRDLLVRLVMAGDGQIQALSVPLTWTTGVVEPVSARGGELLAAQGGTGLVLSPRPGTVDIGLLGVRARGISGQGVVAEVMFRVLTDGDPGIGLGTIRARTAGNVELALTGTVDAAVPSAAPAVTTLHAAAPNPFNPMTTLAYDIAAGGRVTLRIYSIDGRLVRSLVDARVPTGRHRAVWQGRDDGGRSVASGTYVVRLEAPGRTDTKRIMLLK